MMGFGHRRVLRTVETPQPVIGPHEPAWDIYHAVAGWIRHAETKAGVMLTGAAALSAAYPYISPFPSDAIVGLKILWAVPVALLALAVGVSGWALMPQRKADVASDEAQAGSLIFFDDIARRFAGSRQRYISALNAQAADPTQMRSDIAAQIWALSHVAKTKYNRVNRALSATLIAVIATVGVHVYFAAVHR